MGITFKENCPDIRNSKVVDLIQELQGWNVKVVVTDPWADAAEVLYEYGITLMDESNPICVDSIVVAVGHTEYRELSPTTLRARCRGDAPVMADVKALYDRHQLASVGFTVFRF